MKDVSLTVIDSDLGDKLSTHVRIQFPYREIGQDEHYGVVQSKFIQVNQATSEGLVHPEGDCFRHLVYVETFPCEIMEIQRIRAINWLLKGTPGSRRTLAMPNAGVLGTLEDVTCLYLQSYVRQYIEDNRFGVDRANHAIANTARTAFDIEMPGGRWRTEEDRSITLYLGDTGAIEEIFRLTHPGQIPYKVDLL
jgi:hypothetical protein